MAGGTAACPRVSAFVGWPIRVNADRALVVTGEGFRAVPAHGGGGGRVGPRGMASVGGGA